LISASKVIASNLDSFVKFHHFPMEFGVVFSHLLGLTVVESGLSGGLQDSSII
jgi:hypothetical protein